MIKMNKRSMNPDITNDNPLYSMEGITYGVYVTNTCGPEGDTGKTLVLDESGYAEVGGLYSSTYFIREIESSVEGTGYAYDPTIYSCWVNPGEVSWLHDTSNGAGDVDQNDVTDEPQTEDVDVIIQKHDLITQSSTPSGDGTLADALFEVRYFPNLTGEIGGNATRRWNFRTDDAGRVDLRGDLAHAFVSGDALYRDPITNEPLFPIGTYAIRELKAPASYEVPVDNEPIVITITAHGTGAHDVSSGPLGRRRHRQREPRTPGPLLYQARPGHAEAHGAAFRSSCRALPRMGRPSNDMSSSPTRTEDSTRAPHIDAIQHAPTPMMRPWRLGQMEVTL